MTDDVKPLPKSLTELPDAPPEEYPRAFGGYVFLTPLARGGMGEVFLAKHGSMRGLEKHCVVKTLRPHLTDDREYTTRFIDEARIVVQLGHRNICHVFDVGTVGERYYLAMEYVAGKDLRALTNDVGTHQVDGKSGVVFPGLAIHVVAEVLEALDYAHRHKDASTGTPLLLVHRDVSPQNVMLSWEGEVKLIDFGLAASTLKMEQTSPNVVMGKLAYMAPEQVRGEKVDGRADMFAAAVILYEMLVGERFYEGRSPYEIWGIAAQGGFRPRNWQALDDDMRAIIDKALAGKADERQNTCIELREQIIAYGHKRGLHGDAPMLRSLMQQVYADDIEKSRRLLSELTKKPLRTDPLTGRPSGVFSVSTEPTMSLARSPSSSEPIRGRSSGPHEVTEPTEMAVKAMFGPRRRAPFMLAAAAVLATVAVVGFAATWINSHNTLADTAKPVALVPPPTLIPTTTPPVTTTTTPTTTTPTSSTIVAENDDGKPKVVDAATPPPEVKDTTKPSKQTPVTTRIVETKPVETKPVETKPVETKPVEVEVKPVETKPVETKPVETKPVEAKPVVDTKTLDSRADAVIAKCDASMACVAKVRAHRNDYGGIPFDQLIAWKAVLKSCEQQCGIAP